MSRIKKEVFMKPVNIEIYTTMVLLQDFAIIPVILLGAHILAYSRGEFIVGCSLIQPTGSHSIMA